MKALVLRLDAPLLSFGAPAIDQNGIVQSFPALSMLTGLLANALGLDHRDVHALERLQDRMRYAARIDRRGEAVRDYQTVDLGHDWMLAKKAGWTTLGRIAKRAGGSGEGTYQRERFYRADSVHTVAVTLTGDDSPSVEDLAAAVREPHRPLFIGRKPCLPAAPLVLEVTEAESLLGVLAATPRAQRADSGPLPASWWYDSDDDRTTATPSRVVPVTDERDWQHRVHVGRRLMREGHVDPPQARHA